jgi:outer membrane lipoprotein-sorting protein
MIPVEIEIYDNQQMIAKISLSNISLNGVVKQEEFKIKK